MTSSPRSRRPARAKKPAGKKRTAKKAAAKKRVARKSTAKKTDAKKRVAKTSTAKTTDAKKRVAKTSTTKKTAKGRVAKRALAGRRAPGSASAERRVLRTRAKRVVERLMGEFPSPRCALDHETPLQLLVATILSAQCTDERVNMVTPSLFAAYPDARSLAEAPSERIESLIRSTGFFRNKTKNIQGAAARIHTEHGGKVPETMDELLALPGVARKTANVVLGVCFQRAEGVVVDTHVGRISRLLGLTTEKDPVKVERDLMDLLPREEWIDFSHRLILHGRKTCIARRPQCAVCVLRRICPSSSATSPNGARASARGSSRPSR